MNAAFADDAEDRRVRTGARLFRALLAADLGLDEKANEDGSLTVAILTNNAESAEATTSMILGPEGNGRIQAHAVRIVHLPSDELPDDPVAAIFIADRLDEQVRDRIVLWAIEHGVVSYSPFAGDVEAGVLAGISVEARVRPMINTRTLAASGIQIKPFFLNVAKVTP